jgi:predicted aminopeptidase
MSIARIRPAFDTGRDAAAQQADLLQRCVLADLRDRDLRQYRVLAEGGRPHVVVNRFAVQGESRRPVGHEAPALGYPYRLAQVGLARRAEVTLAALGCVKGDDVVSDSNRRDARTDFLYYGTTLMAQYRGE